VAACVTQENNKASCCYHSIDIQEQPIFSTLTWLYNLTLRCTNWALACCFTIHAARAKDLYVLQMFFMQGWNCRGEGVNPQFMSTDTHFWVKISFTFQFLGTISSISATDPPVLLGQFFLQFLKNFFTRCSCAIVGSLSVPQNKWGTKPKFCQFVIKLVCLPWLSHSANYEKLAEANFGRGGMKNSILVVTHHVRNDAW